MIHLKLKSKDQEIPFTVYNSMSELPFKRFLEYERLKEQKGELSDIETVAILTDIPVETWKSVKDVQLYNQVKDYALDSFSHAVAKEPPKTIYIKVVENEKVKQKTVTVPKDLGYESVGQFEDFQAHLNTIRQNNKGEISHYELLNSYAFLFAIYFQPQITGGDYDYRKAQDLVGDVMHMGASDVFTVGNFFLKKSGEYLKNTKGSKISNTKKKK